mmetsp:Transcript_10739/g.12010  ORF Transcript_10739/g.12010 Transcript_10739/m.12010 type:complete len:113 (-) Transcript_10739:22-360(-)
MSFTCPSPMMPAGPWHFTSPKDALSRFVEMHISRRLTDSDIVYSTTKLGEEQHRTTIKFHCINGIKYVGGIEKDEHLAEQSAFYWALHDLSGRGLPVPVGKQGTSPYSESYY